MSTIRMISSIAKSVSVMLLIAVLLATACPICAYAFSDNPNSSILESFPVLGEPSVAFCK